MNYKSIIFSAFLVQFAIRCSYNIDMQIEQLKNVRIEKQEELSHINKIIIEKENLIDAMTQASRDLYSLISETSDEQKTKEFKESISLFQKALNETRGIKKEIKKILLKKALNDNEDQDEIARLKSWIIRYRVEYQFLRELIKRYEQCLQSLLTIDIQLEELQQEISQN
jgi:hypothetical protein